MRLQVGLIQHPSDRQATHSPARRGVAKRGREIVKAPPRGWAVGVGWLTGSDRYDVDLVSGGKTPGPPRPWRLLEPSQPVLKIPHAPEANGMAVTTHLSCYPTVGQMFWRRDPED
jgi:hypothetical protein